MVTFIEFKFKGNGWFPRACMKRCLHRFHEDKKVFSHREPYRTLLSHRVVVDNVFASSKRKWILSFLRSLVKHAIHAKAHGINFWWFHEGIHKSNRKPCIQWAT